MGRGGRGGRGSMDRGDLTFEEEAENACEVIVPWILRNLVRRAGEMVTVREHSRTVTFGDDNERSDRDERGSGAKDSYDRDGDRDRDRGDTDRRGGSSSPSSRARNRDGEGDDVGVSVSDSVTSQHNNRGALAQLEALAHQMSYVKRGRDRGEGDRDGGERGEGGSVLLVPEVIRTLSAVGIQVTKKAVTELCR